MVYIFLKFLEQKSRHKPAFLLLREEYLPLLWFERRGRGTPIRPLLKQAVNNGHDGSP